MGESLDMIFSARSRRATMRSASELLLIGFSWLDAGNCAEAGWRFL